MKIEAMATVCSKASSHFVFLCLVIFIIADILVYVLRPSNDSYAKILQPCVMTSDTRGRLGNSMFKYGALYALARVHGCQAVLDPRMQEMFQGCFNVSMMPVHQELYNSGHWTKHNLPYLMAHNNFDVGELRSFVLLEGYPTDWRYFQQFEAETRREFQFVPEVKRVATEYLQSIHLTQSQRTLTYIGVHVRRTDYILYLKRQGCVTADANYLLSAMKLLHAKYPDSHFIVSSDDLPWCQRSLKGSRFNVSFVQPQMGSCSVMAILSQCNHSIITQGSYGFWSAYLAGGDTVYFSDYCNNNTEILPRLSALHLPHWLAISANLSSSSNNL